MRNGPIQSQVKSKSLCCVTTKPTQSCQKYTTSKKRMPVILKPEDEAKWLQHHPIEAFALSL
jgi:putative SOS response-associated peptidase YedK